MTNNVEIDIRTKRALYNLVRETSIDAINDEDIHHSLAQYIFDNLHRIKLIRDAHVAEELKRGR